MEIPDTPVDIEKINSAVYFLCVSMLKVGFLRTANGSVLHINTQNYLKVVKL